MIARIALTPTASRTLHPHKAEYKVGSSGG